MKAVLELEQAGFCYQGCDVPALQGVDLSVEPGEIVVVTGVSGCGKSTLVRMLNGLCPHYFNGAVYGRARVCGIDCTERGISSIAQDAGTLFQDPQSQFFGTGVEEELAFALRWRGISRDDMRRMVREQSRVYGIDHFLKSAIGKMSDGQKQLLAMASLSMSDPKALILDEPTANLDPEATRELALRLKSLAQGCMAVLVVDHRLYWLKDIADRVLVLDRGRTAFSGDFHDLGASMLSRLGLRALEVDDPRTTLPDTFSEHPAISAEQLRFGYRDGRQIINGLSFASGDGIVAVIGKNGAGKTTLARLISGLENPTSGRVLLDGREFSQRERLRRVSVVLQNADHQLYMKSVLDEVQISLRVARRRCSSKEAMKLLSLFSLEELATRHPHSLSGGQKQRLVIACAFAKDPSLVILDEPTSGLDGANMERIAVALEVLAGKGALVWIITHDLELMKRCATSALRL